VRRLVRRDKQWNRHYQRSKILKGFQGMRTEERNAVLEFAERLKNRYGSMIQEIILFGSKVRGEGDKESDIDILIVLKNLSWEIKKSISELAAKENLKYNVLISTIRYDVKTWEAPVVKASPFGKSVREEGIWL
jgi:predicted nucleotidyltransferase